MQVISAMLTPSVTQSLPEAWQGHYTIARATEWIVERDREGVTLLVLERLSRTPVGLMMLFENNEHLCRTVRLGYLLSESVWNQGLASELIQGFVEWCKKANITSIMGGVKHDNAPSQRALEKNGFVRQVTAEGQGDIFFELKL